MRPDGKPLAAAAKATLQITRIEWQTNRLDGAGDTAEFESKPVLQVQWEKEVTLTPGHGTRPQTDSGDARTGGGRQAR